MRVLVTELIWPQGIETLEASAEVEYDPDLWKDSEALREKLCSADAAIVRNQTAVDAAFLAAGEGLRAVGRLGVGLDNIDLVAAGERGVPVVAARNVNAVSVAEYVMAAVLQVNRNLAGAGADVRAGGWDRRGFTGAEVYGKTLGLVGMGEISRRVARRAAAFGMRVVGHDPFVAPYDYLVVEIGVELVNLDDLLARSDFVSLHVPLNDGTRGLISGEALGKMKPSAWLVNTARGGVVDEVELVRALENGSIGGAVLDVLEDEPPPPDSPLRRQERLVLTPHIAGLTEEAQESTSVLVVEEVLKVLRGEPSLCVVG